MDDHKLSIGKFLSKYNLPKPGKNCKIVTNPSFKNCNRKDKTNQIFPARDHSLLFLIAQAALDPSKILSFIFVVLVLITYIANQEETRKLLVFLFTVVVIFIDCMVEVVGEVKINQFYKRRELDYNSKIIVNDSIYEIDNEYIRKYDIIALKSGDIVPADIILISSNNLYIQRNTLADNREVLKKTHTQKSVVFENSPNVILAGDKVINGKGIGVVVRIGKDTQIDKIYEKTIKSKDLESYLYTEIRIFFLLSLSIGVIFGGILALFSLITGGDTIDLFDVLFSACLSLIPECIPSTVKYMLFSSVLKLEDKGIIIRDAGAIEKLGLLTIVCTDKNAFVQPEYAHVTKIYDGNKVIDIYLSIADNDLEAINFLKEINHITGLISINKSSKQKKMYHIALENMNRIFSNYFITINRMSKKLEDVETHGLDGTIVDEIDFMSIYLTGTIESILEKCTKIKIKGKVVALTKERRKHILNLKNKTVDKYLSLIALAQKSFGKHEKRTKIQGATFICIFFLQDTIRIDTPLITNILKSSQIGFSIFCDDAREIDTRSSRKILGINNDSTYSNTIDVRKVISSFELLSSNSRFKIDVLNSDNFIIFQANNESKNEIIKELKRLNHIVCYIGTDLNDCSALNDSDLGICFENSGIICKEASSILLRAERPDDLIYCIEEGRLFFVNLQKAIKLIASHILPQLMPSVTYAFFGTPVTLTPILLIFLNYMVEMIPAIFMLYEQPEYNLLIQRPTTKEYLRSMPDTDQEIIGNYFIKKIKNLIRDVKKILRRSLIYQMKILSWNILVHGTISTIGCFLGFYTTIYRKGVPFSKFFYSANENFFPEGLPLELRDGEIIDPEEQIKILFSGESTYFIGLAICQFASMLVCRREQHYFFYNFFDNIRILIYSVIAVIICFLIVYLGFFQRFLLVQSPSVIGILFPSGAAILILVFDTLKKYIIKRYSNQTPINIV